MTDYKPSAKDVQELRQRTGAGMMDCRNALTASNGDINLAIENLRKSGIAKAEKRADRVASEGSIVCLLAPDGKSALAWSEAGGLLRLWFEPANEPAGATELAGRHVRFERTEYQS